MVIKTSNVSQPSDAFLPFLRPSATSCNRGGCVVRARRRILAAWRPKL